MKKVVIWHNPRCSKSRETLKLLQQKGVDFEIFEYLKEPVSESDIEQLLQKLELTPIQLIRTKEDLFQSQYAKMELTDLQLIKLMSDNTKLIERPIVLAKEKAAIGRPPENVLKLLDL
ncbi:MAG: arsenate reductase (glutaredoxin) [Flavobacteriales bacterium]|nr:arsenate reductase (glutaredoxin) [Flavobacteriales bacterium]